MRKWERDPRLGRVFRLDGTVRYHGSDFATFLEQAAADDKAAATPPAWREAERPASMPASMRRRPRAA